MDNLILLEPLLAMVGAFLLALPVGWDREQADRSLGLRTFPLVAVGACAFVFIARRHLEGHGDAIGKVIEGVVSGVGFLGAAAVVKRGVTVHGTATAAAIWVTAAIGVAAAFGDWLIGASLSVLSFATLRFLLPIKAAVIDGADPLDRPGANSEDSTGGEA